MAKKKVEEAIAEEMTMEESTQAESVGIPEAQLSKPAEVNPEGPPEEDGAVKPKPRPKVLTPGITRGRMPIAVVWQVRYGKTSGGTPGVMAALFGTTTGKIQDIQKNSTFKYLPENFAPTAAQQKEGLDWLCRHVKYDEGVVDELITELESMPLATKEQEAAFNAIAKTNRAQPAVNQDGSVIPAGGGNRRVGTTPKEPNEPKEVVADTSAAPSSDELLA